MSLRSAHGHVYPAHRSRPGKPCEPCKREPAARTLALILLPPSDKVNGYLSVPTKGGGRRDRYGAREAKSQSPAGQDGGTWPHAQWDSDRPTVLDNQCRSRASRGLGANRPRYRNRRAVQGPFQPTSQVIDTTAKVIDSTKPQRRTWRNSARPRSPSTSETSGPTDVAGSDRQLPTVVPCPAARAGCCPA